MENSTFAKSKLSYHLILKYTLSQTFNSLEKTFFSEIAILKLARVVTII